MPDLLLGPMLRYAGQDEVTVWVETDAACRVTVHPDGVPSASADTISVLGHHYALVHVTGLEPDAAVPYAVTLDGEHVWPLLDAHRPPSVLRTSTHGERASIAFGSCRVSAPHEPPYSLPKSEDPQGREVDALRGLALRMMGTPAAEWPHALVLVGDQVYADEVPPAVRERLRGEQVADFDEYALLYQDAWGDPILRWLLATVPTAMIFDDHDVHDDWNTSHAWVREMRRTDWWGPRIVGAFASYVIYQHWGNLSPAEIDASPLFARLRAAEPDVSATLLAFAKRADEEIEGTHWSFYRDIGPARLLMVDSRAGRVLTPGRRAMVDADEWDWISEHAAGDHEHLLIGTSLPMLLAPGLAHLEAWNEAVCDGAWGRAAAWAGEKLRQALDLEHWPAFQRSFRGLAQLLREVGAGERGPAPQTIALLSGDVHHAYLAEVGFPAGSGVRSAVWQATCSPFRNPLDKNEQKAILAAWSEPARQLARALARSAGVEPTPVKWRLVHDEPWFDNQVAWIEMDGADATFRLEKAHPDAADHGDVRLEPVFERRLNRSPGVT